MEDGTDVPITGTGALSYTFADIGEHKVTIEFKEDVTDFEFCFCDCTRLTGNIPENLFANCPNVTDFGYCFRNCLGLTGNIPENLFANCPNVTDFGYCFSGCTRLTSIPENLFTNNTAVNDFRNCFRNCSGLTGNVPVDNDGTPIYNRSGSGKEGYAIVRSYADCFYNCTGLTDYNSIPSSWGGGGT